MTLQVKAQTGKVWTSKYEAGVYSQYAALAKDQIRDAFTRDLFTKCCIEKTKARLPNGLESVSDTELNRISKEIVNSCALEIRKKLVFKKWTPEIERYLKYWYLNMDTTLNIKYREQMSECMVGKLKIIYPDGLTGSIPDDVAAELSKSCSKELMKVLQWSPELEKSIKESFANAPAIKKLKPMLREAICNCYISKTKVLYPKGLPNGEISKEAANKILQECSIKKIEQQLNKE